MSFKEKLDIVLKANKLGINTASGLETRMKTGKGAIRVPYRNNEYPGIATQKKIVEFLRINPNWWYKNEGDIFLPSEISQPAMSVKGQAHEKLLEKSIEEEAISQELWQEIKETNKYFQKELDRAWDLINRIIPPSQASKRVTANNRK